MQKTIKKDKGQAGLTILLSIIVMLFIIGLIVMIFSLMSSELQNASWTSTSKSVKGEAITETDFVNASKGYTLAEVDRNSAGWSIDAMYNATTLLLSGNYTLTGNVLYNATDDGWTTLTVNYTYTYDNTNTATDTINDTGVALAGTTDWFDIFIVISAMVVLILLTVLIISAIRNSGMIEMGSNSGKNTVGTA